MKGLWLILCLVVIFCLVPSVEAGIVKHREKACGVCKLAPDQVKARSPDQVKAKAPDQVKARKPDQVKAKACGSIKAKACGSLKARKCVAWRHPAKRLLCRKS